MNSLPIVATSPKPTPIIPQADIETALGQVLTTDELRQLLLADGVQPAPGESVEFSDDGTYTVVRIAS